MTRRAGFVAAAAVLGAAVGSAAAVPWFATLAAQRSIHTYAILAPCAAPIIAVPFLSALSLALFLRFGFRPNADTLAFLVSLPAAATAYTLILLVSNAPGLPPSYLRLLIPGALLLAAAAAFRRPWPAVVAGVLCFAAIPQSREPACLTGARLAIRAFQYSPPPPILHWIEFAASAVVLAAIAGLITAWLLRTPPCSTTLRAALAGIVLVLFTAGFQLAAFVITMGTAGSALHVWAVFVALWAAATAFLAFSRAECAPTPALRLIRVSPALPLLAAAAYVSVALYGSADYRLLTRYHSDTAYTYLHFRQDGSWRRTVNSDGSTAKLARCRRFLAAYPSSAYRPAALFTLAEIQYELWDFTAATQTLTELLAQYPDFGGSPQVFRAISSLAAGDASALLRSAPPGTPFSHWQQTRGALLSAVAAENRGQPHKALGLYAAYVDYVRQDQPAAWAPASISYADARSDRIITRLRNDDAIGRLGAFTTRVLAAGRPVAGARLVLVQPHADAALPTDSLQFTGPWTIPAWNGFWGVSDHRGLVHIHRVPYGSYEVIVGLPLEVSRRRYVIASPVPTLTVDSPQTSLPTIDLVPAIQLVAPANRTTVSSVPRLSWRPWPTAHHYSVSLVLLDLPTDAPRSYRRVTGETCWARHDLPQTHTLIDPAHFTNGHSRLLPGATYMWMVYAHDPAGRILSSSEHYADVVEPCFTVRREPSAPTPDTLNSATRPPGRTQIPKGGTAR